MKHLGDITKINGAEIEPVHCIIGGSPCQDLSVAGKRAGLSGERSGLFVEQVRIVKEMREKYGTAYPRFMVWENVPGAFSSNKGADFAAVLTEIIRVVEPEAPSVDVPAKGWSTWGGFRDMDGRWSVAWRVHDAQYWGVPQRRRRIALVADFGGDTASEILFERNGLSGDIAESGASGQRFAEAAEAGASYAVRIRGGCDGGGKGALVQTEKSGTLGTGNDQTIFRLATQQGGAELRTDDRAPTLTAGDRHAVASCFDMTHACDVIRECGEIAPSLQARMGTGGNQVPLTYSRQAIGEYKESSMGSTCSARDFKDSTDLVCAVDCRNFREGGEINGTPQAKESGGQSLNLNNTVWQNMMARRLTPLECERLQGFPARKEIDIREMTKDEYIAWNLQCGNIVADSESGKVFATRGSGGVRLSKPKELLGSVVNGYKVVNIRNGTTKLQCRIHRIIWISVNGVVPDGYCIDHINNDKQDNRLSNLQLLTPTENSHKAKEDGLYKTVKDNKATKISPELHDEIAYLYATDDFTMRELAEVYGISKSRISQIVKETGWTDIGDYTDSKGKKRKTSDSARYKALGNSIALPFWQWMLRRMCEISGARTMGSLFDGIGGFPLCWERINGDGSCRWASEIEEFPIAVTKRHFKEE